MMNHWMYPALLMTLAPVGAIIVAIFFLKQSRKDARRDPLTSELLAQPGATLQKEVNVKSEDALLAYLSGILSCAFLAQVFLSRHIAADLSVFGGFDYFLVLLSVGAGVWACVKLIAAARVRRVLYQGMRGEMAAAQEISTALLGNRRLFNDLNCESFNIDHVVVSPSGIFAVETKSRRKLAEGSGKPKVIYDGEILQFPGWQESEPIAQAKRQAQWLKGHLRKSTGLDFPVQAVLALPGWWVESTFRAGPDDVKVINPKNSGWLFAPKSSPQLSDAQVQQISFELEKLAKAPEIY